MAGLKRRMDCLKIHVGQADILPKEYIVLDIGDAQTLCGAALDKCDMDCPCVTVDEETGERTVIREAVRVCEMAKVFKRLMIRGNQSFAECQYSMLTDGKRGKRMMYKANNIDPDKMINELSRRKDKAEWEYKAKLREAAAYRDGYNKAIFDAMDMLTCSNYEKDGGENA